MKDLAYLQKYYRELLDDCVETGLDFFETKDRDSFYKWSYHNPDYPEDIHSASGATKAVIWTDELPYVIKIPFIDKGSVYRDFCRIELQNYEQAHHFPEIVACFAWVDYLFEYEGHPIYIMEKVDCDEDSISDAAYSSSFEDFCEREGYTEGSEEYEDVRDHFSDEYYDWWEGLEQMESLFCDSWGADIYDKFRAYCETRDINDLHTANWGWRGSELVAVDYSGI